MLCFWRYIFRVDSQEWTCRVKGQMQHHFVKCLQHPVFRGCGICIPGNVWDARVPTVLPRSEVEWHWYFQQPNRWEEYLSVDLISYCEWGGMSFHGCLGCLLVLHVGTTPSESVCTGRAWCLFLRYTSRRLHSACLTLLFLFASPIIINHYHNPWGETVSLGYVWGGHLHL